MRLIQYLKLARIPQWYKNLVIFLPIFFTGNIFNIQIIEMTLLGFLSLSFISSANYIINDIIDIKKDKVHPEKKKRPLAAGKVKIFEAIILALIFIAASVFIGISLSSYFLIFIIALFALTLAYSLFLKNEPIIDILIISTNFVLRAISGVFIIKVFISPWLIICPFFLALFLAVGKRDADLKILKENATKHRYVLKYYDQQTTNGLMIISTTCLLMSYSLFAFQKTYLLLLTLPFAIYFIFRYYNLAVSGSEIARHPELSYKDWRLMLSLILWAVLMVAIFYVQKFNF